MLNIQKVILSEFCQHASLELKLSSGLTGLFGPNGCGKSNIANAICGAFTGDFSRHSEGAKGCIRQNQPNDAYVEIHGTIAEQPFRLRRDITRKGVKHSLWLNGDKHRMYDKAGDIETWLTDVSGLTPQIMAEFLFIGQQDLYGFLETTDAQRSRKFAALCGTRGYEHRRDVYHDFLKRDKAKATAETSVSVEFLESAIRETRDNLNDVDAAIADCRRDGEAPGAQIQELEIRVNKIADKMRNIQSQESLIAKFTRDLATLDEEQQQAYADMEKAKKNKKHFQQQHDAKAGEWTLAVQRLDEYLDRRPFDEVLAELRELQKRQVRYVQLTEQLHHARATLENLVAPVPFDACEIQLFSEWRDKHSTDRARVSEKIRTTEQLLNTLKRLKGNHLDIMENCPLCGADASDWNVDLTTLEETLIELNEKADSLDAEILKCSDLLKSLENKRSQWERYRQKQESLAAEIIKFEEELNAFGGLDTERDIDAEIDTLLAMDKAVNDLVGETQTLKSRCDWELQGIRQCREQLEAIQKKRHDLETELATLNKEPEKRQQVLLDCRTRSGQLRDRIRTLRELENQLNVLYGSKQSSEKQLADLQTKLTERQAAQESQGPTAAWLTKFETALNWLKKDGLPRHIHRAVLDQLVSTINRELTCFDGPFDVSVNDDLTFTATFPDGVRSIAKDLSGGQKVMLAMAFWSAINRTFAQNLGIMILDEPTDGLDQENKQSLYRIMEEWAKLLRHRGQQVMIITHDTEMEDSFDSVLVLESQVSGEAV